MKLFKRKDQGLEADLIKLEALLYTTLQPVSIRPDYMTNLGARLLAGDIPPNKERIPTQLSNFILVVGGLIGSLLMIIGGVKGLISLIGVAGQVIQRLQKSSHGREPTPA
jgi:hypothetical protein